MLAMVAALGAAVHADLIFFTTQTILAVAKIMTAAGTGDAQDPDGLWSGSFCLIG